MIGATATSGLAVSYKFIDDAGGVCKIRDESLDIDLAASRGSYSFPLTCVVQARQNGNEDWLQAEPVTRSLVAGTGGSRIVLASEPTKTGKNEWRFAVKDEGDVANEIDAGSTTPMVCSAGITGWSGLNANVLVEVKDSGLCQIVASGDGRRVYGGINATIEFEVVFEA